MRWFRRNRQPVIEPDVRVQEARAERRAVEADRPQVESLVKRLRNHLEENHFGERLFEQMIASRREP